MYYSGYTYYYKEGRLLRITKSYNGVKSEAQASNL